VYLINRLPSHKLVPYKILLNKEPDYTHLKVLGCLCFSYTRPYNKHKLEPRSQLCVFLGYGINQKGYKCLQLSTNKILVSRNVQFDELTFPFKDNSPSNAYSSLDDFSCVPLTLVRVNSQIITSQVNEVIVNPTGSIHTNQDATPTQHVSSNLSQGVSQHTSRPSC
jgi:hypothetical protein